MKCSECDYSSILYCHYPGLPKYLEGNCIANREQPKWCPLIKSEADKKLWNGSLLRKKAGG